MKWAAHRKEILSLAFPSIIAFAMITFTGTANLIIIGQIEGGAGELNIAIVGVCNIVMNSIFAIFSGLGNTVNYMVAQNYGAGDMKKGVERTSIALVTTLAIMIVVLLTGVLFPEHILRLVGGEQSSALASGETYLMIRFLAMACFIPNFVFHGFFRGIGDTRTPMVLSLTSNLLMIFLTYAWALGRFGFPDWGLYGAGWAFFTGELAGLLGCLYVYFFRLHPRFGTRSRVRFNRKEAVMIWRESGKLGVQESSFYISILVFTAFVAYLGPAALAANEVAGSIISTGMKPLFAFGATATILVGQRIGAGNPSEARKIGMETAVIGTLFLMVPAVLEFVFAGHLARIYTDDPEVYETAVLLIMIAAFLQLFDGLLNFFAGGLRGIGDTAFLWKTSFILGMFFFVPLAYLAIFIFQWGSLGAWLSLYSFIIVFSLAAGYRFYRTEWMKVRAISVSA